jgi:hypothetical protein
MESATEAAEQERKQLAAGGRSGIPAKKTAARAAAQVTQNSQLPLQEDSATRRLMKRMTSEMRISPVQDVLVSSFDELKTVLTVSTEYFTDATREFLREGEVKVMGKLTRILSNDEQINLSRRTLFGITGDNTAQSITRLFSEDPNITFKTANPLVSGPAVQILPMAIFV